MKRITCREIGKQLGLSHVTVSLALRDHPSLPESTKDRVRQLAAELNYRPDPVLGALNAYRQANRDLKYQATLGWIHTYPNSEAEPGPEYLAGARERSEKLGFNLETFSAPTAAHWSRLPRILKSRRIEGLFLPPRRPDWEFQKSQDFPWRDFSTVALGEITDPPLHLVISNQFQCAARTVRELHALGYRRIGIVMPGEFAKRTEFHFLGGYLSECAHLRIPLLHWLDPIPHDSHYSEHAARWLQQHRLDAVISSGDGDILPALEAANLRAPQDIAVAYLYRSKRHPEIAGIDQNSRQIGEAAANQLIDLIRRNERGIPVAPMRHLIEGTWVPAPSTPRKL